MQRATIELERRKQELEEKEKAIQQHTQRLQGLGECDVRKSIRLTKNTRTKNRKRTHTAATRSNSRV